MRSGDHLGDAKMSKGHLAPSNLTFLLFAIDENGFRRIKEEGQIYKRLPQIFQFLPRDLVMIFQSLIFTPFFKDHIIKVSPRAKIKKSESTFCSQEHVEQVCQISWR